MTSDHQHSLSSRDQSSPFISRPGSPVSRPTPGLLSSPSETIRDSYIPDKPADDVLNLQLSQLSITKGPATVDDEILTVHSFSPKRTKSMWRHMRPELQLHDNPTEFISTTSREEYLYKEIIELKIKYIKLREFLISLMDNSNSDPTKIYELLNNNEGKLTSELDMKLQQLQLDYDEVMKLNNDLHTNLSTFESKLKDKEIQIDQLHSYIDSINASVDEIIKTVTDERTIEDQSYILPTLEEKLNTLKQMVNRVDNHTPLTPSSLSSGNAQNLQESMNTVHQLLMRINDLEVYHETEREHLKTELSIHRAESSRIKKTFEIMTSKFNELKSAIDKKESHVNQQSNQIGEFKRTISDLQNELQGLRKQLPSNLDQQPDKITDLSSKLQLKSIALRQKFDVTENLKIQLENSLQKERNLRTGHIRLSSAVELFKKENDDLKFKIEESTFAVDSMKKKISSLELQYKELLLFDSNEFKKLIHSYDKIADDRSLLDSKIKYEKLSTKINEMKSQDLKDNNYVEFKTIHNSIFEFFVRATDILINDHVSLLLKENDNHEIKKLKAQVEKLSQENESLQDELSRHEFGLEEDSLSPISKLRTSILTKKWKAERERRILEDLEAKKRFHEMEMEIQKLKELNSTRTDV